DRFCKVLEGPQDTPRLQQLESRAWLSEYFNDSVLLDLLELPVYIYGGYREGQIDAATFGTVFRSIFLEGCGSPPSAKHLLDVLVKHYKGLGGELKMRKRVRQVETRADRFAAVILEDGTSLSADHCLSSAGLRETGQLAGQVWGDSGDLSVFETVVSFNKPLAELGVNRTLMMLSHQEQFDWRAAETRDTYHHLTLSANDNYAFPTEPSTHHLKLGCFQKGSLWLGLDDESYSREKAQLEDAMLKELTRLFPDILDEPAEHHESLTPRTVVHYTSHLNGGIYGGVEKRFDGSSPLAGLSIIGNDQGGIGIMGALTSGVIVANYQVILRRDG
ncbi:MAG: hypothetical protein AAGF10_05995, partial [Verrucomicrobiota bacterium]